MRVSLALIAGLLLLWDPDKHAAIHKHGGYDEVATATPGANAIPKAGSDGKLDAGWLPASQSGGLDSGLIVLSLTACPSGYAEETSLNGKFVLGTLNANGNVTGTGGTDNITPAGTNSAPTFTGSAMGTHAHELPYQIASTTTTRQIAAATFGTGTSRAATAVSAAGTANTTSAAVALSQAVSAGTPAGTVSAPTFTGTQFDNRPAFVRVIFCKRN